MAIITPAEFLAQSYGYLKGTDLQRWCSLQLLIKAYEVSPTSIQDGVMTAQSEAIGLFRNKYDVKKELAIISGPREETFVKILSILAIRNILGNNAGIGEVTKDNYAWCDERVLMIQQGTFQLALDGVNICLRSGAFLVPQNFGTLG